MLFAISMMNLLGISANLMSLGAIDFGLIVDGAVIIVESIVHRLTTGYGGQQLTQKQMDAEVTTSSIKIRNSAAFGEIIILMVYIPILALVGIEGKMFRPMAQTVMLAIAGALILSLTYVPMMAALFLSKRGDAIRERSPIGSSGSFSGYTPPFSGPHSASKPSLSWLPSSYLQFPASACSLAWVVNSSPPSKKVTWPCSKSSRRGHPSPRVSK